MKGQRFTCYLNSLTNDSTSSAVCDERGLDLMIWRHTEPALLLFSDILRYYEDSMTEMVRVNDDKYILSSMISESQDGRYRQFMEIDAFTLVL